MSIEQEAVKTERRDRQRVTDAIGLEFRKLSELPAAGERGDIEPVKPVRAANKYDIEGYADVKRDFPAVTEYIDSLEERIRQLRIGGEVIAAMTATHKVSLSASGIAFADSQLLQPGESICLKMTLFPGQIEISCDGTIVSAGDVGELAEGDQHTYRVSFTRIQEHDRNLIEGHVSQLVKSLRKDIRDSE